MSASPIKPAGVPQQPHIPMGETRQWMEWAIGCIRAERERVAGIYQQLYQSGQLTGFKDKTAFDTFITQLKDTSKDSTLFTINNVFR